LSEENRYFYRMSIAGDYGTYAIVKGTKVNRLQSPSSPIADSTKGRLLNSNKNDQRTASRLPVFLVVAMVLCFRDQRLLSGCVMSRGLHLYVQG
jgi:hypothetical protein